ncbi:MAG: carboxypeptidase-like regulatory domain-containing protein [Bryobacteraceae bacterium]
MTFRILACLLLCLGAVYAQGERGNLNGTVTDPSGSAVPAATVKAVNVGTAVETEVKTTGAGVYRIPYVTPGTYRLSVSASGFKLSVRDNVILAVAQTLTLDFTLEVGAITESGDGVGCAAVARNGYGGDRPVCEQHGV